MAPTPTDNRTDGLATSLALLMVMAATILVYWPGLSGPFVFDDRANLAPINDWLEGRTSWLAVVLGNDSGLLGRPVSMASLVLNVALLGANSWGLKLGNLILHLLNGWLVFALYRQLARHGCLARISISRDARRWLVLFAAAVWIIHPLLASTVLYVVQRMAMLSTLFMLWTMLAYLRGRDLLRMGHQRRGVLTLALALVFATLAIFAKENGVLALPLCGLLELFVFVPSTGGRRSRWSRAFVAGVLVLPLLIAIVLVMTQPGAIFAGYIMRPFDLTQRLLTESRVLWSYVGDLLLPSGPRLGFYHDDFVLSRGIADPPSTLLAIIAWLAVVAAAWQWRRTIPGFAFGLGVFLVGHSIESSIFPLMLYFEHRNYLPAIGAIWALLSVGAHLSGYLEGRLRHGAPIAACAGAVLLAILSFGTFARAMVWRSEDTIIAQALLAHPDSRGARFDSIALALNHRPPDLPRAKADIAHLSRLPDANSRRLGAILQLVLDCRSGSTVQPNVVDAVFAGPPAPFEEDIVHGFEWLSDEVGSSGCGSLDAAALADRLAGLLDRWEPKSWSNWRLRFRAANLYMAADRNDAAIKQAQLAYYQGSPPTNTAIRIAGVLIHCGNTIDSTRILDAVEPRVRPSDYIAHQIIADDRNKIRKLESRDSAHGKPQ